MDIRNAEYERALPTIRDCVRRAESRYGCTTPDEREDLRREADLIYTQARYDYRPGQPFDRYLRFLLKRRLADIARKRMRRMRLARRIELDLEALPATPEGHWTDDLSQESLHVVRIAAATRPGLDPRQAARRLKDYLFQVGWSAKQVALCWKEIAEAMIDP